MKEKQIYENRIKRSLLFGDNKYPFSIIYKFNLDCTKISDYINGSEPIDILDNYIENKDHDDSKILTKLSSNHKYNVNYKEECVEIHFSSCISGGLLSYSNDYADKEISIEI